MQAFIKYAPVGPLQTNCYIIGCKETKEAAIIDCGASPELLVNFATNEGYKIKQILLTHGHIDHVGGLEELVKLIQTNDKETIPLAMHRADDPIYNSAKQMGLRFGYKINQLPAINTDLHDKLEMNVGNLHAIVYHFPGHTPGSVLFHFPNIATAFAGDFIFKQSIGRMDLPGGSQKQMRESISKVKRLLPDNTRILCGHGPETTFLNEKISNPYFLKQW